MQMDFGKVNRTIASNTWSTWFESLNIFVSFLLAVTGFKLTTFQYLDATTALTAIKKFVGSFDGLVVSVLSFYYNNPSSNPVEADNML